MSNRFHNKWHRRNHHTYGNASNPDAGHDPIASQQQPFLGEFVLSGSLSATAPLSAFAAFLYSNNTALCAFAGTRGALIHSEGYLGAEILSTKSTAISAYAPKIAIELASPMRTLSAYAGYLGLDIMSNVRAISARGQFVGIDVFSPRRALSAYGGQIAGEFYSHTRAISALGHYVGVESYSTSGRAISAYGSLIGLDVVSPYVALSAWGGYVGGSFYSNNRSLSAYGQVVGVESYSPRRALSAYGGQIAGEFYSPSRALSAWGGYVGGEFYSNNRALSAYGQVVGIESYSPRRALSAWGGTVGLDVGSPYWGVSSYGGLMAIGAYSDNVALSGYGALTGLKIEGSRVGASIHSRFISLSTGGGGINIFNSRTGIYKEPRDYYGGSQRGQVVLDVGGDVWIDGSTTITGDLSALGTISYLDTNVTVTSSFRVINKGTAAAATIIQEGAQPILQCFDQDISTSVPSLIVDGATNGWVGLGVATPTAPFNIVKSSAAGQLGNSNQPHINIYDGSANNIMIGTYGRTGAASNPYIGTSNNVPFDLYTNNLQRISILGNGNVGINATTPSAKLTVFGDSNSNNRGLSAFATNVAGEFYGTTRALSAWGGTVGLDVASVGTALSAWGRNFGIVVAGGESRINYNGGGNTSINTNNTVATQVNIGNTSASLTTLGNTNINNNASTNTTNIGTGSTTGKITIGNTGLTGVIELDGSPIDINVNAAGYATNIGTGTTTGAVSIGNSSGNLTLNGNTGSLTTAGTLGITSGSTLNVNSSNGRATNLNTGSGAVTTTIGHNTASNTTTVNSPVFNAPNATYVDGGSVITGSLGDTRYGNIDAAVTTATTTVTNQTLVDVTGLATSSLPVGTYEVSGVVTVRTSSTLGTRVNLNFSGTATPVNLSMIYGGGVIGAATTMNRVWYNAFTSNNILNNLQTTSVANSYYTYQITGTIVVTGAGVLKVQIANSGAGSQNSIAQTGSTLIVKKID